MTWTHGVIQVLLYISCNVAEEDRILPNCYIISPA
jgi:hypothetical protein